MNGSGHKVTACYLELHEEGVELKLKVKNYKEANRVWPRGTFILELSFDVI